jgi:rhodanese-related sulfurtransferase
MSSNLDQVATPNPAGFSDVRPADALANLSAFRLIDVRQPDEYVGPLRHIAGAELVPLGTLLDAAADWKKDQAILLICRSGARSVNGGTAMARLGFTRVYNLVGGMIAWNEAKLPVEG